MSFFPLEDGTFFTPVNPDLSDVHHKNSDTIQTTNQVSPVYVRPADTVSITVIYGIIAGGPSHDPMDATPPDIDNISWNVFYMDGFETHDAEPKDIAKFHESIVNMQKTELGRSVIEQAMQLQVKIIFTHDGKDAASPGIVYWDPNSALVVEGGRVQSASLGLIHELYHTIQYQSGSAMFLKEKYPGYDNNAEYWTTTNVETVIANELGEPTRTNHGGTPQLTSDPTYHT